MWGGEGVLAAAGGAWFTAVASDTVSVAEQMGRAIGGGLLGLITAVFVIFLLNLLLAPYQQRNEARDAHDALLKRVHEYEDIPLEISYDPEDRSCFRKASKQDLVWRIKVVGSKGLMIKNVIVRLVDAEPKILDLPQVLHPMESKAISRSWEGDGTFDLRPQEPAYVDILRYGYGAFPRLLLVAQGSPEGHLYMTCCSHVLTITAQGEHGQKAIKHFSFQVDDGEKMGAHSLREIGEFPNSQSVSHKGGSQT